MKKIYIIGTLILALVGLRAIDPFPIESMRLKTFDYFLKNFRERMQPPRARKCDRGRKKRRGGRKGTNFDVDLSSIFDLFFEKMKEKDSKINISSLRDNLNQMNKSSEAFISNQNENLKQLNNESNVTF